MYTPSGSKILSHYTSYRYICARTRATPRVSSLINFNDLIDNYYPFILVAKVKIYWPVEIVKNAGQKVQLKKSFSSFIYE